MSCEVLFSRKEEKKKFQKEKRCNVISKKKKKVFAFSKKKKQTNDYQISTKQQSFNSKFFSESIDPEFSSLINTETRAKESVLELQYNITAQEAAQAAIRKSVEQ